MLMFGLEMGRQGGRGGRGLRWAAASPECIPRCPGALLLADLRVHGHLVFGPKSGARGRPALCTSLVVPQK